MIRYLKIEEDNIVTDMISYPYEGYIKVQKEEIPFDLHNGCYSYLDGEFILDEEKMRLLKENNEREKV